jgi:hypothetical protein
LIIAPGIADPHSVGRKIVVAAEQIIVEPDVVVDDFYQESHVGGIGLEGVPGHLDRHAIWRRVVPVVAPRWRTLLFGVDSLNVYLPVTVSRA